jgi:hypothetical protein
MGIALTVVMRHEPIENPWVTHRWVIDELAVDVGQYAPFTIQEAFTFDHIKAYRLSDQQQVQRWLFTGFNVNLFVDEAEGYFLNVSSEKPCWFVMWRLEEMLGESEKTIAVPHRVMLSYNEAARLLDGGEQVDQVPLDPLILESIQQFVAEHYRPEVKKRHRPESFKGSARGIERKDGQA